ncbi:MAG: methionyl-tRNA formyltransferase [Candidatus Omnitrophica bacterium]|nr:methionyl-tRNA formyltransferase [Candidatus Omnitrophota bacterium]
MKHFQVQSVITAPDRPAGRGYKLSETPVKQYARQHSLPVFQPESLDETLIQTVSRLDADFIVLVAYGKILPERLIRCARLAALNVHPSLLPSYRGAAPMEWALLNGEKETGITVISLERKLDSGGILTQKVVPVTIEDDIFSLRTKLMQIAPPLLLEAIQKVLSGERPKRQEGKVSYAPRLSKAHGEINWNNSAWRIYNQIRALADWPVAYTFLPLTKTRKIFRIKKASLISLSGTHGKPGEVLETEKNLMVACGEGIICPVLVQLEGKKLLPTLEFLKGIRLPAGVILGNSL